MNTLHFAMFVHLFYNKPRCRCNRCSYIGKQFTIMNDLCLFSVSCPYIYNKVCVSWYQIKGRSCVFIVSLWAVVQTECRKLALCWGAAYSACQWKRCCSLFLDCDGKGTAKSWHTKQNGNVAVNFLPWGLFGMQRCRGLGLLNVCDTSVTCLCRFR